MMKLFFWAASLLVMSCSSIFAGTITTDGTWYEFLFEGAGSQAYAGGTATPGTNPDSVALDNAPWTFSGPAVLNVLDLFSSGDRFEAFDGAVSLGLTSEASEGGSCYSDITCALGDSRYSFGTFALGSGDHSITILVNSTPFNGGAAVLQAVATEAQAPEPGTMLLVGAGLSVLGLARRKR
jgi:hypothetical protein